MNAITIGAAGALNALDRVDASARRMDSGKGDIADGIVEQAKDKAAFRASLAVIRTADEMATSLLDIVA